MIKSGKPLDFFRDFLLTKHTSFRFFVSPVEAHSKKPDEARNRIVQLMGDLPRVELFARQSPPGWDVWGNEVANTVNL